MLSDLTWILKGLPVIVLIVLILFLSTDPKQETDTTVTPTPTPIVVPTNIHLVCTDTQIRLDRDVYTLLCREVDK